MFAPLCQACESPRWVPLLCYAVCLFRLLRPLWWSKYPPLAAYQVYALAMHRIVRARQPRCTGCVARCRSWPPDQAEALQAFAAVLVLTAETLALLMHRLQSLAIVAGKGGCQHRSTDPRPWHKEAEDGWARISRCRAGEPAQTIASVVAPSSPAILYIIGHRLALRAVRIAKGGSGHLRASSARLGSGHRRRARADRCQLSR